jgi:hypothetical protein
MTQFKSRVKYFYFDENLVSLLKLSLLIIILLKLKESPMKNYPLKKILFLLSLLCLVSIPTISRADYCAEIKERYWKCVRSSMSSGKCSDSDNVSIPPECLNGGSKLPKGDDSSSSSYSPTPSGSKWNFFRSKKSQKGNPETDPTVVVHKPVKVVNIKPKNGKIYFETEEEVDKYVNQVKEDILKAFKEGKRVRLQYNN